MYQTVTLTGTYRLPDGSPAKGPVEIIPSEKVIIDSTGDVILSGRVKVQLDETGSFSVALPATDDPTLNPTGFGYTVSAKLHHQTIPAASFSLPAALGTVDIADLTFVDPSAFAPGVTYVTPAELAAAVAGVVVDTSGLEAEIATKADAAEVEALEGEVTGRLSDASLSATFAPARDTAQPEAFNLPALNAGTGINPTVVIGVDATTGIIFGADRPTNDLSMSADGGRTWSHDRGMPADVNHVQLHKVVRFGAHIYLFAVSGVDARAGVYRAVAPTAATDTLTWETVRTNRITNPSFETGVADWTAQGGPTVSNPTDGGKHGSRYARLTATGTGVFTFNGNTIPVTAGQPFAASVYVRGTPGVMVNLRMTWTGGTGAPGSAQVALASSSAWQRLTYTETVPAGATAARMDVRASGTIAVGNVVDIDAALFETNTSTIGTYVEGNSARLATMSVSTSANGSNFEAMNGKSTAFAAGSTALMLGDYGDFAGGPIIQRSLNGTTWTTVWSSTTSRHVHAVAEDPYNPGHWWATIGDGSANTHGIIRSTNNGATWSTILTGTDGNIFQSVQISFDAARIYFAADHYGSTAFFMDRDELVIRNYNLGNHTLLPIPGGVGGRVITDLATTSGSTAVTSASLTSADKGRTVRSDNTPVFSNVSNWGEENYLTAAGSGTGTLKAPATATGTVTAVIGGDRLFAGSYMGAVDPATGVFYGCAMDTSSSGNTYGLFAVTHRGATPLLLGSWSSTYPTTFKPVDEVFIHGGYVYAGTRRFPLIDLT